MSLLFRPRSSIEIHQSRPKETSEDVNHLISGHVELCSRVISVFLSSIHDFSQNFSDETWIVILKVLLGICDTLLKVPIQNRHTKTKSNNVDMELEHVGSIMGDKLCEFLISVFDSY